MCILVFSVFLHIFLPLDESIVSPELIVSKSASDRPTGGWTETLWSQLNNGTRETVDVNGEG